MLLGTMAVTAIAAIAVPLALIDRRPASPTSLPQRAAAQPARIVARNELPPVEPIAFVDLAPQDARSFNATVPYSTAPNLPARPFNLTGVDAPARARATDCLAAAVIYEAGDDPIGQRAVAQVVLNRLRHPAFPKTVCGVVFQGSERSTGCQFTFTCDGALARRYALPAWSRAQALATRFLNGEVERKVGTATHYHTDWVVPYWSASLDKISAVDTHLFFRWTGWWGTPPAFRGRHAGTEPTIAKMAALSPAHRGDPGVIEAPQDQALAAAALGSPVASDPDSFVMLLDPALIPAEYAVYAQRLCGERTRCKLLGWADPAHLPRTLPVQPQQIERMTFSYLRDRSNRFEKALWNCDQIPRADPAQCMKDRVVTPLRRASVTQPERLPSPERPLLATPERAAVRGEPLVLEGVRRAPPASDGPPASADGPIIARE